MSPDFINAKLKTKEIIDPLDPDLSDLYKNVWRKCFPLDLLPFKAFKQKVKERKFQEGVYHVVVLKNADGAVVAGLSFYFFHEKKKNGFAFGADEYIGVVPDLRKKGLGMKLVGLRTKILSSDARTAGKNRIEFIMGEYYDEKKISPAMARKDGFDPYQRKNFWKKAGMKALAFDYENPSIFDHRKIERVYTVGIKIADSCYRRKIPAVFVASMLSAYYRHFYGVRDNHAVMRRLRSVLKGRDFIKVIELV